MVQDPKCQCAQDQKMQQKVTHSRRKEEQDVWLADKLCKEIKNSMRHYQENQNCSTYANEHGKDDQDGGAIDQKNKLRQQCLKWKRKRR